MRGARRFVALGAHVVLLSLLSGVGGCFGFAQNPSYFPYLLPAGDIIQTHAKPISPAYYENFDPHAIRLELRPLKDANGQDVTNQVRTQHVLIATIYDEKDVPRRSRRVEWMIEGAGSIMEVDEAGTSPGRGYKVSNQYGVSYTAYCESRLSRSGNNKDKRDGDVMIRPGQTWCVISAPVEGDTYVTCYAPGIADWDKNKVYTTIHWVDSQWEFPQPQQKQAGTEAVLVTKVYKATTKQPLEGYQVRYRLRDGPAAGFQPDGRHEVTVKSNLSGHAIARLQQVRVADQSPPPGINLIDIEVVRPPDPNAPSGTAVVVARGTTSVEWLAPNIVLNYTGPAAALVGDEVTYTASVQNFGKVPSDAIELRAPTPKGMEFVRSNPPPMGNVQGDSLFTLGGLQPGGAAAGVALTFRAKELGTTSSIVTMRTGSGQSDRKEVVTAITDARLAATIEGPPRVGLNAPVPLTVKITNTGSGVLNNVKLAVTLTGGLADAQGNTSLNQTLAQPLAPGQTFSDQLTVFARQKGPAAVNLVAVAGSINASATYAVEVQAPTVSLNIDGPGRKYVGRTADYTITVKNPTDQPLNNVFVRDTLPQEMEFVTAGDGQFNGRDVIWNLGVLAPGQSRDIKLTARCKRQESDLPGAQQSISVTDNAASLATQQFGTVIFGAAGLKLEMRDLQDPVPVNGRAEYEIILTNTGTETAKGLVIRGQITGGLRQIEGSVGTTQIDIIENGQKCIYKPFDLPPGTGNVAKFRITVLTGPSESDGVFRCTVSGGPLQSPVIEDENTHIGGVSAIPVPNPPGAPPGPPPGAMGAGPAGGQY